MFQTYLASVFCDKSCIICLVHCGGVLIKEGMCCVILCCGVVSIIVVVLVIVLLLLTSCIFGL